MARSARALLFAAVSAAASPAVLAAERQLGCGEHRIAIPPAGEALVLTSVVPAWLESHERGIDVELDAPGGASAIQVPPRHGWVWAEIAPDRAVTARRTQIGQAPGEIALTLHCALTQERAAEREWVRAAVPLVSLDVAPFATPVGVDPLAEHAGLAPSARTRAMGEHLLAQRALLAARSAEAADGFAAAQAAWLRAGDVPRAYAAMVARVEDLMRQARHEDVLRLARSLPDAPDGVRYYGVRLEAARCLALQYRERRDEAAGCYAWVQAAYARLGEVLEHAAVSIDAAYLARSRGDAALAGALADDVLARARGPQSELVRGRAELLRADLALDRGDVLLARRALHQADADFAAAKALRWQVNAALKAAELWALLGAYGDAQAAIAQALALLDVQDAPARRGTALVQRARLALELGDLDGAAADALDAARLFGALSMAPQVDVARAIECRARRGQAAAPCAPGSGLPSFDATLVEVERLLALGDTASASARLAGLHSADPELRGQLARLRVLVALRSGQPAQARAAAREESEHWARAAGSVDNPVLALLLRRRAEQAAALGIAATLQGLTAATQPLDAARRRELGHWLVPTMAPARHAPLAPLGEAARALDAAHAPHATTTLGLGPRLALLAAASRDASMPEPFDVLSALREQLALGEGDALLAVLPADDGLAVVILHAGASAAWRIEDAAGLRGHLLADGAAPTDPETASRQLAAALVHRYRRAAEVRHWWILDRGPAAAVPWALLPLPDGTRLGAHARITRIEPLLEATRAGAPARAQGTRVLLADPGGRLAALPALATEARELARQGTSVAASVSRDEVLAALQQPWAVLQISTHGEGAGGRLGGSGLWLAGSPPQYLSGLELLAAGVRARTVMLNACAVAAPGAAGDLSFARSLLLAGAADVVAPQWPVGDEAAAAFAVAFHAALRDDADVATALHRAQRDLRGRRASRRPLDWAPWSHLRRVVLHAPASSSR